MTIKISKQTIRALDAAIENVESALVVLKRAREEKKYFLAYQSANQLRHCTYGFCSQIANESIAAAKDWGSAVYMPERKKYAILVD